MRSFSKALSLLSRSFLFRYFQCRTSCIAWVEMHPPLTLHRHPMCAEIIEQFQKCHLDHPIGKFFGECTDLKIKLDHCFRQEKALKRKANFEESKKLKERLQAHRKEIMREDLK
ncbi:COX assembly mitochondrial protein 2 homolog isoform X1 [Camellia sinensis]|uniref:COX assembly mitochondrial protein 2 homolog isoform X1 n=2 Tax=Camellia sinensis TaxID=4442 RepID=UPI001035D4CF|nr:COX assembly mitochondrial protein 2 homolog isoform X1 [Camellia sinensis]